jgi:hypothetical protein
MGNESFSGMADAVRVTSLILSLVMDLSSSDLVLLVVGVLYLVTAGFATSCQFQITECV